MNILLVNGSPLGKKGHTFFLQKAFVKGAREAGATVDEVFLNSKKIKPCLGCYTCWTKTPGTCIIDDDHADLLEKCRRTDTLVLATPLYVDGMTAQAKLFIDRLIPLARPEFFCVDGHCRHPSRGDSFKNFLLISNCGFHELDNFDALVMHCRRISLNMHAQYLGHLLRPHGPLMKYRDLMPEAIDSVLNAVAQAAVEIVTTGTLSQATMDAVSAEMIPKDDYMQSVNAYWQQALENIATD